jgi:hypothetical protein
MFDMNDGAGPLGKQPFEGIDTNLRPGLKLVAPRKQFGAREETQVCNHGFAFLHFWLGQPENVDDSEVDAPDLGGVVVEQGNDAIFKGRSDLDLFIHFALDSGAISILIPGKKRFVGIVHVTADSDRALSDKPLLARLLSAHIMQHRIVVRDDRVGDDLLVRWIVLGLRTREKEIVSARKQRVEISPRLEIQSMKAAELIEKASPND